MSNKRQKLTQPEEKDDYTSIMAQLPSVLRDIVHGCGADHRAKFKEALIDIRMYGKAVAYEYGLLGFGTSDKLPRIANLFTIKYLLRDIYQDDNMIQCRTCEMILENFERRNDCNCPWSEHGHRWYYEMVMVDIRLFGSAVEYTQAFVLELADDIDPHFFDTRYLRISDVRESLNDPHVEICRLCATVTDEICRKHY